MIRVVAAAVDAACSEIIEVVSESESESHDSELMDAESELLELNRLLRFLLNLLRDKTGAAARVSEDTSLR